VVSRTTVRSYGWKAIDLVLVTFMVLMVTLVFINVVMRYGFNSGIMVSAELSRFLFVWVTMLSAVVCMRDGTHLDLRLVENFLPERAVRLLRRVVNAAIALTCGMLLTGSYKQVVSNWGNASPLSGLPTAFLYLAGLVAGLGIMAIALYRLGFPDREPKADREILE
jgi:TRAP-type C4-dicarboxylate transport system permease small subunit